MIPTSGGALLIRGGRIIDPAAGIDGVGDLWVDGGRIAGLRLGDRQLGAPLNESSIRPPADLPTLEAAGLVVCPGFVDLHCHLREPGFEEKETIASGTLAAARGGFTTVCAMPNTNPPLDSRGGVEFVLEKAASEGAVRVLPIACITRGQRGDTLTDMMELADAGAIGFSDDGRPVASARIMRLALEYARPLGVPVIDHCEEPSLFEGGAMNEGAVATRLGLKGIPNAAEEIMVARDIALARLTGGRLHIAHVSTAGSVALIRAAKAEGLAVTAEVTPHHLTLTEDWVLGGGHGTAQRVESSTERPIAIPPSLPPYDAATKVNPPLRTAADRRALVAALADGTIDAVATDHAPHDVVSKLCEYDQAAFGISAFETALASLLALVHRGEIDLPLVVARLTVGPAAVLRKPVGTLGVGAVADITVFDPEATWEVDPAKLASKGKNTPLAGCVLRGVVVATIVGGRFVHGGDLSG